MWSAFRRFWGLGAEDRRLVWEAAAQLLCVWLALRLFSFPALRRLFGGSPASGRKQELSIEGIGRMMWAVSATARRLPVGATCLVEALAAAAMLRRRGSACELRFGVLRNSSGPTPLAAHAWIEHEGIVILGHLENLSDYTVLSAPGGL